MTTLNGFPMLSQRDSDKNADFDCVPASIAACLEYLTGHKYTAGQVKDAVYGASYTGGTDAHRFIDYCRSQGVSLTPIDGTGPQLVASLKSMIGSGHPCLITEPDPYAAGWLHVCAAYSFDDASITVMDPWIDQAVKKSDSAWATQLVGNEIWVLEKGAAPLVSIHVPSGWTDDGKILTASNGVKIALGFRDHILKDPKWDTANLPMGAEYHADQVLLHNADVGSGQRQLFRDTYLWWTDKLGVHQEPYVAWELDAAYKALNK